jgi:hypothetical protein
MALKMVPRWRRWLGRSGRLEFCISMAGLAVLHPLLVTRTRSDWLIVGAPLVIWLLVATRRLNDLLRGWWLAWLPWVTFFVSVMLVGLTTMSRHAVAAPLLRLGSIAGGVLLLILLAYLGFAPSRKPAPSVDVSAFD